MAISTQLIGKLGGGVETKTVSISTGTTTVGIPAGWRKAAGVFTCDVPAPYGTLLAVFGQRFALAGGAPINGGGCSRQAKPRSSEMFRARSRGTDWSNPWGGDLDGDQLTDHRNPRRRQWGQNLRYEGSGTADRREWEELPRHIQKFVRCRLRLFPSNRPGAIHLVRIDHRYRAGRVAPRVVV